TDTGRGMSPEMLARLYTPFDRLGADRSSIEGTGLGLALSKRLVEAMHGVLHVESTLGTGTTFTIELPIGGDPQVAAVESTLTTIEQSAAEGTLLYIEDNLVNLRLVERVIQRRPGLTLLSAMLGARGVELARDHRPGAILLDLHLPDIPGTEVLMH